ncbi:hypothetical protein TIFTF001_043034 [Ficus carica]|uniref:Uncharacterized protein n=1 Tax=Ficus carica TaxID=3494 RepID=A0AA88CKQ0_FICCA|nr:hypothetical protein TIFTF001_043034 [Ficus carica]
MLRHVDILPASEPPRLAGITPPTTGGVPGSRPTKNGMDYVLGLPPLCPIARSWVLLSGGRGSVALPGRSYYFLHELPQVALAD